MFFRYVVCLVVALLVFGVNPVVADTVTVDLEYRTDTLSWELYALINDTGSGSSGANGLAALRALIDNIDFGNAGNAVNIASGIGAIDPVQTDSGPRAPVLLTSGGTLDILYGQDISDAPSVVGNVGNFRVLIADGSFPDALIPPAFGDDDSGTEMTNGNFLNVAAPGPFGAVAWDEAILNVLDVTTFSNFAGDYDNNGIVDAADYRVLLDSLGALSGALPNDIDGGVIGTAQFNTWKANFGNSSVGAGSGAVASGVTLPEPSTLALAMAITGIIACHRKRT